MFNSGLKIVMVPLEVTHTALITRDVLAEITKMGSTFATLIIQLLTFFKATYKKVRSCHRLVSVEVRSGGPRVVEG